MEVRDMAKIGLLLRYTDEQATWANCPAPEVRIAFRNIPSLIFGQMQSEHRRRQMFQGDLIRLLAPELRLSVHLNRASSRFSPVDFVWVSVGATLEVLGRFSLRGSRIFASSIVRYHSLFPPNIGGWAAD